MSGRSGAAALSLLVGDTAVSGRVGGWGTMLSNDFGGADYRLGVLALCAAVIRAARARDTAGMRGSAEEFHRLVGEWSAAVDNREQALHGGMPTGLN